MLMGLECAHSVYISKVILADGSVSQAHGLVHRDLKPQNMFLVSRNDSAVAKVGDLGISKAFEVAGLSGATVTGSVGGTFPFMPRQQVLNFNLIAPLVLVEEK